jgi:hypothetical protein
LQKHFGVQIRMMKSSAQIAKSPIWLGICIQLHGEASFIARIVRHWLEFSHMAISRMTETFNPKK